MPLVLPDSVPASTSSRYEGVRDSDAVSEHAWSDCEADARSDADDGDCVVVARSSPDRDCVLFGTSELQLHEEEGDADAGEAVAAPPAPLFQVHVATPSPLWDTCGSAFSVDSIASADSGGSMFTVHTVASPRPDPPTTGGKPVRAVRLPDFVRGEPRSEGQSPRAVQHCRGDDIALPKSRTPSRRPTHAAAGAAAGARQLQRVKNAWSVSM